MIFSWLFNKLFGSKKKKVIKKGVSKKKISSRKKLPQKTKRKFDKNKLHSKGGLKRGSSKKNTGYVKASSKEEFVGEIIHFFPKVKAGVIHIRRGFIKKGDGIHIKGSSTDFKQKILSMQIQREPVESAGKGQQTGILFKDKVRIGDKVFKIKP